MNNKKFQKAWLKVAKQIHDGKMEHLCLGFIKAVGKEVANDFDIDRKMGRFSKGYRDSGLSYAWFFYSQEAVEYRVLFACLFSNMTIDEFNEVCQDSDGEVV